MTERWGCYDAGGIDRVRDAVTMIYVCDIMLQLKLDSVKDKILELIQCWAHAFKDNSDYRAVGDVYTALKNEGE